MEIGVSTACFYPEETERALRRCGEMGVRCTEIFFNAPSELDGAFLRELVQIREAYGIRVAAVHPFTSRIEPYLLFSGYERRYRDGLDFYRVIADKWRDALLPNGLMAFEVGIGQADEVLRIMRANGFGDIQIVKDLHGIPRVVYGRLCKEI